MGNSFRFIFHLNLIFAQFFRGFVCKSVYLTIDVIHKPLIDDDSNNALYKHCKVSVKLEELNFALYSKTLTFHQTKCILITLTNRKSISSFLAYHSGIRNRIKDS